MSPADCTIIIPVPRADPDIDAAPRITLDLHARYLSANSVFLRGLLDRVPPLHLAHPLRIPPSRLPRLLPSPPTHPVLFLPVPDPSSIQSLFHWMYSGDTRHLERALDQGIVHWEGLVRNVEYLCLPTDIKVFLGRWYRRRRLPAQPAPCPSTDELEDDASSSMDENDDECDRGRARDVKPLVQLCAKLRLCTV